MKRSIFERPEEEGERSQKIEHAGSSIQALVESCGYTQKLDEKRAVTLWADVVTGHLGDEAAEFTVVEGIDQGQLTVRVANAAWRQRLAALT